MSSKNHQEITRSSKSFPFFRFKGTHREIGKQYGEACRDLIKKHSDLAFNRLTSKINVSRQQVLDAAIEYRPFVKKYASFLDEEILGIAEGANIPLPEVYFLQLRAEIYRDLEVNDECTTFAILPEATADGKPLIGQNADLPNFYSEIGVIIEFVPEGEPSCLMITPAGQISYIGINSLGLGVFANFLNCDGWRIGFPRYMYSRLSLTKGTVNEAIDAVRSVKRASSRNLMMLDTKGNAANLETTPTRDAVLQPEDGVLAHSNHYISNDLVDEERQTDEYMVNTCARLKRMKNLLKDNHGQLDVEVMTSILRDREGYPHTLCRELTDSDTDTITFASVIARPSEGKLWIAMGPPNKYEYKCYTFSS